MDREESWEENWERNLEDNGEDNCEDNLMQLLNIWEQRRRMAAVQVVCHVVHVLYLIGTMYHSCYVDRSIAQSSGERESVRQELMTQLTYNDKCRDITRMSPYAFARLCELLRGTGRLHDNKNALVEEQLVKFLYLLAHKVTNREMQFFFRRSGETVSRHFHDVLKAIITLEDQFLKQPTGSEVPLPILTNNRFYPYFKVNIIFPFSL